MHETVWFCARQYTPRPRYNCVSKICVYCRLRVPQPAMDAHKQKGSSAPRRITQFLFPVTNALSGTIEIASVITWHNIKASSQPHLARFQAECFCLTSPPLCSPQFLHQLHNHVLPFDLSIHPCHQRRFRIPPPPCTPHLTPFSPQCPVSIHRYRAGHPPWLRARAFSCSRTLTKHQIRPIQSIF